MRAKSASALMAALAFATVARADELSDLAAKATTQQPVLWYESSQPEQIALVTKAFNAKYPAIRIQYVRIPGGNTIAARIIQETQANARTASLMTSGSTQLAPLLERKLVLSRDWQALRVAKDMPQTPFAIPVATSMFVGLYNSRKIPADKAPATWDDFISKRFEGKLGTWVRPPGFVDLVALHGEDKTRDLLKRLVTLKPLLYAAPELIAQQIAAGEIDAGIGFFHSSQATIDSGAPVAVKFLDPTPINTIWGVVIEKGSNPEGAQVLAAWLVSPEGARIYEDATKRGNPWLPGTETAKRVGSNRISQMPLMDMANTARISDDFSKILGDVRAVR